MVLRYFKKSPFYQDNALANNGMHAMPNLTELLFELLEDPPNLPVFSDFLPVPLHKRNYT